jgi:enamine deaminase RidA (YjgF/YER057c/UK114 family)
MHALDHMPPTHLYNVTFERGTRVIYGDRSHFYISGTASIDEKGNVAHPGDVRAQTRRMVENVDVLLRNHGGSIGDMKVAIIYLRNSADASAVESELEKLIPSTLPRIVLTAPVCRPGWLVEMEGIAVNNLGDRKFKSFE